MYTAVTHGKLKAPSAPLNVNHGGFLLSRERNRLHLDPDIEIDLVVRPSGEAV